MAQTVKRLSTMRETWVQSLGWEDPLEKEMAIHSSTIAWKRGFPWWLSGKGSACSVGDLGSIPGSGGSPGGGHGNPLQYS